MVIKATKAIELGDLIADFDGDGTEAIVKLVTDQEINLGDLDLEQVRKSLKKGSLRKALDSGDVIQITPGAQEIDVTELTSKLSDVITWVLSNDIYIQFQPTSSGDNPYTGAPNANVDIVIAITDGDGTVDIFNSATTVVVTITSGTASGKQIQYKDINGNWVAYAAGPITVKFKDGKASLRVKGTSTGTILLGLSGGNSTLNKSDTATCTLA